MQLSFILDAPPALTQSPPTTTLAQLPLRHQATIRSLELPSDIADRLMALGFLPGNLVALVRKAPSGDPCVFRVDGAEIALRRETAEKILIDPDSVSPSTEP